jgi:hypothetical protein
MNNFKIKQKPIDNGSYILIDRREVVSNGIDPYLFLVE